MDSDDSQDASSGNESEEEVEPKGPQSPLSTHSDSRDSSRSSPEQNRVLRSRSRSPDSEQDSPSSNKRSNSSRSPSCDGDARSRSRSINSRPRTPKSPESGSVASGRRSQRSSTSRPRSPQSPGNSEGPRSPSPVNSLPSNSPTQSIDNSKSPKNLSPYRNSHSPSKNHLNNDIDKNSVISNSSQSSKKSKSPSPDRLSGISDKSDSSRESRKRRESANLDDGNTSDSSESSVDSSSRKNKNITTNVVDTQPEEISDGDMESEDEKSKKEDVVRAETIGNVNVSHEDLSDVSDLDDSFGGRTDDEEKLENAGKYDEPQKNDIEVKKVPERNSRTEDGEEQLDFEAEDGECAEIDTPKDNKEDKDKKNASTKESGEIDDEKKEEKETEELEEGEVTDEDEVRPEETEPRPVCRFFSRGQCTWGASCRFLHPGVTDKGNYTMFELIRPVVPGEYGREERNYGRPEPPPVESAWERGLRTAKEMLRKSIKRKEQDIDFEEKKMNLSLAQEEFDKENGYYTRVPSPEPRYVSVRHVPVEYAPVVRPPPEEYYGRRQVLYEPEYAPPPRERLRAYREVPSHRVPEYYPNKYEGEQAQSSSKVRRPKREVIVQRVEERQPRGDEWSDPWMRSKSPVGRKGNRKRSYSSGSSYSSSSSSHSSSASSRSSYKSRSRSPRHKHSPRHHKTTRQAVSPSVIVSERKAANERAALMNPPAPKKKAPSPGMMRAGAQNPPAPSKVDQFGRTRSKLAVAAALARVKGRQRSSRSSSESSGSSSSDSDSSGSSSSSSRDGSSPRRTTSVDLAMAIKATKAIDALKGSGVEKRQIKLNLKNPVGIRKQDISDIRKAESTQGKKRPAGSPPPADVKNTPNKKATSRREELLKQLKAVEDAIAKKRSKVN